MLTTDTIHCLDAMTGLRKLPNESIDCVMTSPPYWSMRDYKITPTSWADGSQCALGLEPSVTAYVEHLGEVFEEVRRVLRPKGTFWINLGDAYAGSWGNYSRPASHNIPPQRSSSANSDSVSATRGGVLSPSQRPPTSRKPAVRSKSLCLIPERFALTMVERGWILRNRVVWHKPNPMPSSAMDRFTSTWEHIFFFVKSPRYHFDLDAVRVPHKKCRHPMNGNPAGPSESPLHRPSPALHGRRLPPRTDHPGGLHPRGKNPGDVITELRNSANDFWSIATQPLKSVHLATYPEKLCERPILAGCPPDGIVLDPFMGSGTTAVVAKRLGRHFIGFEANAEYVRSARARIRNVTQQLKGGKGPPPRHPTPTRPPRLPRPPRESSAVRK